MRLHSSGDVCSEIQPRAEKFGIAKPDLNLVFWSSLSTEMRGQEVVPRA
jgi:hypothetical protein